MAEDRIEALRALRRKMAKLPPPSPDEVKRAEEQSREAAEALLHARRSLPELPELKLEFERVELDEFEPIGPIEVELVEPNPGPAEDDLPRVARPGPSHKRHSREIERQVLELRATGLSEEKTAEAVGIARRQVRNIERRNNRRS